MQLIDPGPVPPFDAAAFVTYDNEQDAAPLASELVEDLPEMPTAVGEDEVAAEPLPIERPPFRGKGYLRAEAPPEADDTDTKLQPDPTDKNPSQSAQARDAQLSVGVETGRADIAESGAKAATATTGGGDVAERDVPSRGRRKRKPRRRRRNQGENPENKSDTETQSAPQTNINGDQATSTPSAAPIESGDQAMQPAANSTVDTPTGTADDKAKTEQPTARRRRRRRRSRNRGRGPGKSDGAS